MSKLMKIDLQLFANANTQTTASSGLTAEMKTLYAKELIRVAGPLLIHAQFGETFSVSERNGKTVEFRRWSSFAKATTPLTEGVTPDGVPVVVTTLTKTLEQFGNYTTVSDLLDMTAIDPVIIEVTDKHGENMGLTLDTIVRNELNSGTNVMYAPTSAGVEVTSRANITDDCKLTPTLIARAATFLKKMNAPKIDGSYVAIIHPSVSLDLMTSDKWIDVQKYQNAGNIFNGEIGKLYGVRFVETTEAAVYVGSNGGKNGMAVYSCIFLGKGAYKVLDLASNKPHIIVKPNGSAGANDPLDQRATIGWKAPLYGAKITIPEYILRVEVGSSMSKEDAGSSYTGS